MYNVYGHRRFIRVSTWSLLVSCLLWIHVYIQGMSTMFLLMLSQVDVTKSACNLLMVPILQNMHGLLIMKWTLTTLHLLTKETITPERHSTLGT